jgi:hypothetical protein
MRREIVIFALERLGISNSPIVEVVSAEYASNQPSQERMKEIAVDHWEDSEHPSDIDISAVFADTAEILERNTGHSRRLRQFSSTT